MPKRTFKLYGINGSLIKKFFDGVNINHTLIQNGNDYTLEVDFSSVDEKVADSILKEFLDKFESNIYAENDITLKEQLVKILTVRNSKISVAESFTGGGLSSEITSVSGASKVFYEGVVAYSPDAKHDRLNVSYEILDNYHPVSSQVASGMVKGLLSTGRADFAISTTGIAGPKSDESGYPVGLCYIGVGSLSKITVYKHKFSGSREEITKLGIQTALFHAVMALRSGKFDV